MLPLSLLAALDYSPHVDTWQTMYWFYNYDYGFVQRGLRGEIISYFQDSPTIESVQSVILRWERIVIIANILMLWAVFVPKTWICDLSNKNKLMFTAFAAVLLLAPAWKMFGFIAGFGDEWNFFFAMLALISFLGKQPFLYVLFIVMGYLCHTQGSIYIGIMSMLVVHSILRNPEYTKHWRKWAAAAIMPGAIMASLYLIDQKEALLAVYNQYRDEWSRIIPQQDLFITFAVGVTQKGGGGIVAFAISEALAAYGYNIRLFIAYGAYMLIYAALFSCACIHARIACKNNFLAIKQPVLARLVPYENFMISVVPFFMAIPIVVVGGDWERFLHVHFLAMAIITTYFLWFYTNAHSVKKQPKDKKRRPKTLAPSKFTVPITVFMVVWAYTFAGAPVVVFGRVVDTCNLCQDKTYFLNKHPLGEWFSQTLYDFTAYENVSFHYDGKTVYGFLRFWSGHQGNELYRFEDNTLLVSGKLKNKVVFERYIAVKGGQKVELKLNYRGAATPPVTLSYFHQQVPPVHADSNAIIWQFRTPEGYHYSLYKFHSVSDQDYEIIDFSISLSD